MRSMLTTIGLVLAVATYAPPASATPITYQLSGIASGQIGGTTFTNAAVEYTATGDTANIVTDGFVFFNPFSSLIVSIGGVGTATITDPSEIVSIPFPVIDPQIPPIPLIIFGKQDHPPDPSSITGMGGAGDSALTGYGLTAFGPITTDGGIGFPTGCGTPGHDPCINTTLGTLSYTTNDIFNGTRATFSATLEPVPEPATVFLVSGGLAMLVRRRKRG